AARAGEAVEAHGAVTGRTMEAWLSLAVLSDGPVGGVSVLETSISTGVAGPGFASRRIRQFIARMEMGGVCESTNPPRKWPASPCRLADQAVGLRLEPRTPRWLHPRAGNLSRRNLGARCRQAARVRSAGLTGAPPAVPRPERRQTSQ